MCGGSPPPQQAAPAPTPPPPGPLPTPVAEGAPAGGAVLRTAAAGSDAAAGTLGQTNTAATAKTLLGQ